MGSWQLSARALKDGPQGKVSPSISPTRSTACPAFRSREWAAGVTVKTGSPRLHKEGVGRPAREVEGDKPLPHQLQMAGGIEGGGDMPFLVGKGVEGGAGGGGKQPGRGLPD